MTEIIPPLPTQTPVFHSLNAGRYARQEMIRQAEHVTGRRLVVYFSSGTEIDANDIMGFGDLLHDSKDSDVDLLLQSPGGDINAAEKIVNLCRSRSRSFRVIVAESAKSAATLIALASDQILMSDTSELGPIDPQIEIVTPQGTTLQRPAQSFLDGLEAIMEQAKKDGELSPVHFPLLSTLDPALLDFCKKSILRAEQFAEKWLMYSQMKGEPEKARATALKLADNNHWLSHGAVIDAEEAKNLGLSVAIFDHDDALWQRIWRIFCQFSMDSQRERYAKLFESSEVSLPYYA